MKHTILATIILLSLSVSNPGALFSLSLDQLLASLSAPDRRTLNDGGTISRTVENHRDIRFLPAHTLSHSIGKNIESIKPNVLSEYLMVVDTKPVEGDMLHLYNAMRRVSKFDEITFFNEEKQKVRDLFDGSFRVAGTSSTSPLPDPLVQTIPDQDSFIVLQNLKAFGDVYSEYRFVAEEGAFLFTGTNITAVPFKIFRPVREGNMITYIMVIEGDGFILVYGIGGARVANPLGLFGSRIEPLFSYRTTGLFSWFEETYIEPMRSR